MKRYELRLTDAQTAKTVKHLYKSYKDCMIDYASALYNVADPNGHDVVIEVFDRVEQVFLSDEF